MSTLENRYATLFGSKTSKGQLYGGISVLIFGVVLGLLSLTFFFISLAQSDGSKALYGWREASFATAGAAVTGILLGSSLALPTKTSMRVLSYVGVFFCAVAVLLLVIHYPSNFNVGQRSTQDDYVGLDAGLYAAGFGMMVASIVTSIIGYYLDRLRPEGEGKGEEETDEFGAGYEVPDWVVERDIEFAMKKYGVTFAGDDRDSNKLHVNIPMELGGNVKVGGLGKARTIQIDATQVDEGVAQLSGVRPNKNRALPGEWADESTRALVAFRRQKAENPQAFTPKVGFWAKVKAFFTGSGKGPKVQPRSAPRPTTPTNGAAPAPRRGTTIVIPDEPAARPPRGGRN